MAFSGSRYLRAHVYDSNNFSGYWRLVISNGLLQQLYDEAPGEAGTPKNLDTLMKLENYNTGNAVPLRFDAANRTVAVFGPDMGVIYSEVLICDYAISGAFKVTSADNGAGLHVITVFVDSTT